MTMGSGVGVRADVGTVCLCGLECDCSPYVSCYGIFSGMREMLRSGAVNIVIYSARLAPCPSLVVPCLKDFTTADAVWWSWHLGGRRSCWNFWRMLRMMIV